MGRWNGVHLRLHMLFLVFAVVTLYISWLDANQLNADGNRNVWLGIACVVILFGSVLVHELGHMMVANRLGANVADVVIGPFGGFGPPPSPLQTHSELVFATAGPLANLGVCLTAAFCLAFETNVRLLGLMNPFAPQAILSGDPIEVGMKLTFWINWLLILANMIPAYPFDGGVALRAMFMLANPKLDGAKAVMAVAKVAKVTAIALLICAWLTLGMNAGYPLQTWFALVILAMFVYFSAKREEALASSAATDEAFLGYDFSAGYTSLERSSPRVTTQHHSGLLIRWWRQRKASLEQRRREQEIREDSLVDDILLKVHESGLESLSAEDRALLDRVSDRYRDRPPE